MELFDYVYGNSVTVWGATLLFSIVAVLFYIPISSSQRFQFLHILNTHNFVLIFLVTSILMSARWCLMVCSFDFAFL